MENEVRKNRKLLNYDWDFWYKEAPEPNPEELPPFPTFQKDYPKSATLI